MTEKFIKLLRLKEQSGSHSPSISTILNNIPDINIKVDACFLSNPYATNLFYKYFNQDIITKKKINYLLEYYPSQNIEISKILSNNLNINFQNIFIGNGASEIIQSFLHNFVNGSVVIMIPTFSSYYEFLNNNSNAIFYQLDRNNDFKLDVENYIQFVKNHKPDSVVIINPNNPTGSYINENEMIYILDSLQDINNILVDESFIHFTYEDSSFNFKSIQKYFNKYKNLSIIKSMSKDFGIAGIRSGYGLFSIDKVQKLLSNGYLWNINGFSEYFFRLFVNNSFQNEYSLERIKYLNVFNSFQNDLSNINGLKIINSKSNFILAEIINDINADYFTLNLLADYGIYVRNCNDKIGLQGNFVRIACRSIEENNLIISSINSFFKHIT